MADSGDNREALRALIERIDLDEVLRIRGVQQAISEAQASYWEKRAQQFIDAAPRDSDYSGQMSEAELEQAHEACLSTAQACRNRAQLLRMGDTLE
jgi:hypothetical protein